MKLYDAITDIVFEFGKEMLTNPKVLNMLVDYNAFEESRALKLVFKLMITEGYVNQLLTMKDWNNVDRIVLQIVGATSFNDINVRYIVECLGYGMGITTHIPHYNANTTQPASNTSPTPQNPSKAKPTSNGLNLTSSQLEKKSDNFIRQYKDNAEDYLDSIIEIKGNPKNIGITLKVNCGYDPGDGSIQFHYEINGRFTVKVEYNVAFQAVLYGQNGKILQNACALVDKKDTRRDYGVVESDWVYESTIRNVANISRIVVYWEIS